jgi:hypothetical protein
MIKLPNSVVVCSNFCSPNGVAAVSTSTSLALMSGRAKLSPRSAHQFSRITGQVVIATGKAACRNARPSSAGLKMFCPKPPNTILPNPMLKAPPTKAIHNGIPAGRISPSSSPVIMAEPSSSVPFLPKAHSVSRHPAVAVAVTKTALGPK